jgi:hypothetical protein
LVFFGLAVPGLAETITKPNVATTTEKRTRDRLFKPIILHLLSATLMEAALLSSQVREPLT